MRDRGQQGRAQAVGFGRELRAVDIGDELDALDGDGGLIGQRIEQALLFRRQQGAGPIAGNADDAWGI